MQRYQNSSAPGVDQIIGFWYKSLQSYHHELELLFNKAFNGLLDTREGLTRALARLLQNDETENRKIYRPITCQNIMLKLYSCINQFLQNHCEINKIVTMT